jgi:hypothetical protein
MGCLSMSNNISFFEKPNYMETDLSMKWWNHSKLGARLHVDGNYQLMKISSGLFLDAFTTAAQNGGENIGEPISFEAAVDKLKEWEDKNLGNSSIETDHNFKDLPQVQKFFSEKLGI